MSTTLSPTLDTRPAIVEGLEYEDCHSFLYGNIRLLNVKVRMVLSGQLATWKVWPDHRSIAWDLLLQGAGNLNTIDELVGQVVLVEYEEVHWHSPTLPEDRHGLRVGSMQLMLPNISTP